MRIVSFEIGTDPRFMCLVPLDNEDVNEIADMMVSSHKFSENKNACILTFC